MDCERFEADAGFVSRFCLLLFGRRTLLSLRERRLPAFLVRALRYDTAGTTCPASPSSRLESFARHPPYASFSFSLPLSQPDRLTSVASKEGRRRARGRARRGNRRRQLTRSLGLMRYNMHGVCEQASRKRRSFPPQAFLIPPFSPLNSAISSLSFLSCAPVSVAPSQPTTDRKSVV